MKSLLKIIFGAIIFFILIEFLKSINHYDTVCFITTVIITTIIVILNKEWE